MKSDEDSFSGASVTAKVQLAAVYQCDAEYDDVWPGCRL